MHSTLTESTIVGFCSAPEAHLPGALALASHPPRGATGKFRDFPVLALRLSFNRLESAGSVEDT